MESKLESLLNRLETLVNRFEQTGTHSHPHEHVKLHILYFQVE